MTDPAGWLKMMQQGPVSIVELVDKKILDEAHIAEIGERLYALVAESAQLVLGLPARGAVGEMGLDVVRLFDPQLAVVVRLKERLGGFAGLSHSTVPPVRLRIGLSLPELSCV